jgi:hypothetical protein
MATKQKKWMGKKLEEETKELWEEGEKYDGKE